MADAVWDGSPALWDQQGAVWDYTAPTRAQQFFWRTGAHDMGYGTDVRSMEVTAPGGGIGTTSIQYTATNEVWRVVDPGNTNSNIATSEANRKAYGLALNEDTPSPAMGSVAGARRFIPAGTWSYQVRVSAASAPALVDTYRIRARIIVYRVSADGTTLTLLQELTASQFETRSATSNAPYDLAAGTAVPEIILEPGETIHTAWEILSSATTAAVGATTNTTLTIDLNHTASFVTVPSPGIRTLFDRERTIDGIGAQNRGTRVRKTVEPSAVGTETMDRALVLARSHDIDGIGTQNRYIRVRKTVTVTGVGTQTFDRVLSLARAFDISAVGTQNRSIRVRKTVEPAAAGSQSMDRALVLARSHDVSAVGAQTRTLRARKTVEPSAVGTETMDRSLVLARAFDVSAVGSESFARVVTFVRAFDVSAIGSLADRNAVRVCVPTSALSGPDGAGTTIIRPVIIFDD